jgi:hypothetical protein
VEHQVQLAHRVQLAAVEQAEVVVQLAHRVQLAAVEQADKAEVVEQADNRVVVEQVEMMAIMVPMVQAEVVVHRD